MPNFRRAYIPGGTFFFTVNTDRRAKILCDPIARSILGNVIRQCQARWPVQIDAIVLLPDHLHALWTLPPGDANFSMRWAWIKKEFTKNWLIAGGCEQTQTLGRKRDGRRGVWQPKFWEHLIRDELDMERHLDYIHYNPVKHGLVESPRDWPWSSFHRWVKAGAYSIDWGSQPSRQKGSRFDFADIGGSVGE